MYGKIEKINVENGYIKIDGVVYKFNHPYTTSPNNGSRIIQSGAYRMLVKSDGSLIFNEGDTVDYTKAEDNGLKYIKYIGKPKDQNTQPSGRFGGKKNDLKIYRQHSEKVIAQFIIAVISKSEREDVEVTNELIKGFADKVSYGADCMIENFKTSAVMEKYK